MEYGGHLGDVGGHVMTAMDYEGEESLFNMTEGGSLFHDPLIMATANTVTPSQENFLEE